MIYVAVLIIGVIVLAWDKLGNSAQSVKQAVAAGTNRKNSQTSAGLDKVADIDTFLTPRVMLTLDYMQNRNSQNSPAAETSAPANSRDIFTPSQNYLNLLPHKTTSPADSDDSQTDQSLSLSLSGVAINNNLSCAVINNQIIPLGGMIGPYRLVKLHPEYVLVQIDQNIKQIKLAE